MQEPNQPLDDTEQKAKTWWNNWATHFQEEYGEDDIPIGISFGPGAPLGDDLGLLDDLDGTTAIELGCGGCQFGIAVSKRGADVTGVDISEEQLAYARSLATEHDQDIDFINATVTNLEMLPDATYDLAFSAFAFQWVADLQACFEEAARILKPDGQLVFSVDHPYYKIVDPDTHEFKTSYFSDSPRRAHSPRFDSEMVIYRRRVSDTVQLLTDAGFTVEAIREPGYEAPDDYEAAYGSFEPDLMANVPPTIVYAARKQ